VCVYCVFTVNTRVYRVLRGNATTHFSTSAAFPDCTGQRAREGYGRRGDQTADFTVHRPHHLPDDDAADLDTPATTAAVKINKTWNKLQIDFFSLSIFAFYILETYDVRPYGTALDTSQTCESRVLARSVLPEVVVVIPRERINYNRFYRIRLHALTRCSSRRIICLYDNDMRHTPRDRKATRRRFVVNTGSVSVSSVDDDTFGQVFYFYYITTFARRHLK